MVAGTLDSQVRVADLLRGLFLPAILENGGALWWTTPRGQRLLELEIGPVGFFKCKKGKHLYEGQRCPRDGCARESDAEVHVREEWLFARRISGWFAYEKELVYPCPDPRCTLFLKPGPPGPARSDETVRRTARSPRYVWFQHVLPGGEQALGDDGPQDDGKGGAKWW